MAYATIDDVIALYRPLSNEEKTKVEALLPIVEDLIKQSAMNVGKDIYDMIQEGELLESVIISVEVDMIKRSLVQNDQSTQMSQMSQSALGYSFSGTYVAQGGGVYLLKNELKRLGLSRSKIGSIEFC